MLSCTDRSVLTGATAIVTVEFIVFFLFVFSSFTLQSNRCRSHITKYTLCVVLLKVLSCLLDSFLQKKKKSCLSATFSLLLIWVMPFSILTDKLALLLSPYSLPPPHCFLVPFSLFLRKKEVKNLASALLKPIPSTAPFLLSNCHSRLLQGLRDEGLSDWPSAQQLDRWAFSSPPTADVGTSHCFFILWKTLAMNLLPSPSGYSWYLLLLDFISHGTSLHRLYSGPLPPSAYSAPVLSYTGYTIRQCQSVLFKLNRQAPIDYHWIRNKAQCKLEIKVDNGIISAGHLAPDECIYIALFPLLGRQAKEYICLSMTMYLFF